MTELEPLYYHTIELPDGLHAGPWDCRDVTDAYLGRVPFAGKTVLEVGPANGCFTFEMERRGAQVTCLDLGQNSRWVSCLARSAIPSAWRRRFV
jgi:O-methyltransferase